MTKNRVAVIAFALLTAGSAPSFAADEPQINREGTFVDHAVWMYETADHRFRSGPGIEGTNEIIVMPPPAPGPGETTVGFTHIRHRMGTLGYPMHISLAEKAFATGNRVEAYGANGPELWKYVNGDTFEHETAVATHEPPHSYRAMRPIPAAGPIPEIVQPAFEFAKHAMASLINLPADQKDLNHYVVMFVDTDAMTWVEFAPLLDKGEDAHLGCRFKLGRDMVFGYPKKHAPVDPSTAGPFLQCF